MKSNARFTGFASKFLLMCILLHFSSALPSAKLSAALPPKNHDAEAKAATSSKSAKSKAVGLPLFFEANKGQTDPRVRFLTRSAGYTLLLTPTETILVESKTQMGEGGGWSGGMPEIKSTAGSFVRMQLLGANRSLATTGLEELPGKVNYLIGRDPANWRTGVSLFSKVRTEQVYPGVDLLFHGDDKQLEYDFIVAPGADPSKIAFRIRGAARIEIDSDGDLVLHTPDSDFRMRKPSIYQAVGTERRLIDGNFIKKGKHDVAFQIGPYDHRRALVIDPEISFATFLGGKGVDEGNDITVDTSTPGAPKLYVPGVTNDITSYPASDFTSSGEPKTLGAAGGGVYSFLAKIDPTKTGAASLVYLTFLGGSTSPTAGLPCETIHGHMVLDFSQGAADIEPVIVGQTNCTNFPVTNGSTLTSGGTDNYVTRLMPSGAALDASILFGGNGTQGGGWLDVDGSGNLLLVAGTTSTNLPATSGAYSTSLNNGAGGFADCFTAVFNRALSSTSYLTYLNIAASSTSTSQVGCGGIFGPSGKILAGGNTPTATAFASAPAGTGGFQTTFEGTEDTFAMELDPSNTGVAQLTYWTFIGGGASTTANYGAIPIGAGVVAIVGNTTSSAAVNPPNIPVNNCFQNTNTATSSSAKGTGYLTVIDTSQTGAASLLCGTYFGGSGGDDKVQSVGFDPVGGSGSYRILLGGQTSSNDFPIMNDLQDFLAGSQNAFVSVLTIPSVPGAAAPAPPFATLSFSTYIGGGVTSSGQSETVQGIATDTNHNIYARARTLSSNFFGNINDAPPVTVNGFQTTCTSCGATPQDDVAIFVISSLSSATLQSIAVTPASPSIAQGATQQFTATGTYSDGTIQDLTATATWASSATNIATINTAPAANPGLATASSSNSGSTKITAAHGGVTSAAATLTVTAPVTVSVGVANNNTSGGTIVDNSTPPLIDCFTNGAGIQSGTCSASYAVGAVVTFTETPAPGAALSSWNGPCTAPTGGTTTTCKITVTNPIGVTTALYTNGPAGPFTLTTALPTNQAASTGNGTVNSGVTGGGIDCKFVGTTPPAPIAPEVCSNPAEKDGEVIQLIPVPDQISTFGGWAGTCPFQLSGSNDCYVTMTQAQTVTPVFTATQVTVNVSITGNGSLVDNANPLQIHCSNTNGTVVGPCSAQYSSGTVVTLTESAGTGFSFISFTGCSSATATTCTLNPNAANPIVNVTATFTINSYLLNVSTTGGNGTGTVTSNPNNLGGTIGCGPNNQPPSGCGLEEQFAWPVKIMEVPTGTNTFTGWSASGVPGFTLPASCTTVTPAPSSCSFNMPAVPTGATFTVTASFAAAAQQFALTVTDSGNGSGTVSSQTGLSPAISCMTGSATGCTANYNSGTMVTLTATPGANSAFAGWSQACTNTTGACSVTMTQAQNVTATFNTTVAPVALTVTVSGTNGSVVDLNNAGKIQCSITGGVVSGTCSAPYNPGTQVSLQATGGTSSSFNGWTAGPCGDTSTNPCAFTITTNTNATATFTATAQTFTLMVNEAGSSSGTVTSQSGLNPAINCTSGGAGCSAAYNSGTQVTLTAAPATGSSFMGWAGGTPACSGTGTCTVTMNQTQSVTAIFNISGPAIIADWNVTGEGDNDKQRIDGKSPPLLVKLTNTSTSQKIHVKGVSADNAAYTVTTTCSSVGPGQSCTVSSSFTATSLCQSQNTTVTVADDDPGGNFTFTITGFGADSGLQVDDLTDPSLTPQSLAQSLVGPGVTISNVTYTGAKRAAGTFTSSSNIIGFNRGIVLSTGSVRNTVGPNCSTGISGDNGEPGDPDLSTLSGGATNDAAVLQFDFVPTSTSVSFQYVFASDEYPEFVGQFNDTFAFFLNGANIALIPGTNLPVTINDVNGGSNPQFFVNNNFQSPTVAPVDTEMDGLTVVLTAQAQVTPGNTYHIRLAIADALDFALDSNVFIEAGSLSSTALSFSPSSVAFGNQTIGFESAGTPVTLTNNSTTAVSISQIAATAPFNETNSCPAQLAPAGQSGSSCVITVTITPPSATTFTGSLTVTFNSPTAGQQSIPLSGTGVGSAAATHFLVSAPSTATAGTAFSFTVTAQDALNNTVTTYAGTVHFTSSDGAAVLPANSTLTNGVGTFSATLNTPGGQTIKATDAVTASITGTSGTITVSAPAPTLVSIAATPPNQTILTGQTLQYTATGTYSDNSTKNITTQVVWASSNTEAATVSNATGSQGIATAASSLSATATTTISATLGEKSGSTMLTVTNTPVIITVAPPPPGQPATPTINPGGAAVYGLVLTSQPGFSGTITLSCTSSAPQFITCNPDPASVTIKPGGTTQVAIVLNTFCSQNAPLDMPVPGGPASVLIVVLTALGLASVTWMYRRRPRWVLTFAALTIVVYSIVGCGSTPKGPAGRTPAGLYNLSLSFKVNGGPPIQGPVLKLMIN